MEVRHRTSKKREAMLRLLRGTKEHPNAETLYGLLKAEYPELSLGTVYRNLSLLCDEGAVISVGRVDGHERYDARTDSHPHFVCRQCHRVIDLELPDVIGGMLHAVDESLRCESEGYSLSVSGLCERCVNVTPISAGESSAV